MGSELQSALSALDARNHAVTLPPSESGFFAATPPSLPLDWHRRSQWFGDKGEEQEQVLEWGQSCSWP